MLLPFLARGRSLLPYPESRDYARPTRAPPQRAPRLRAWLPVHAPVAAWACAPPARAVPLVRRALRTHRHRCPIAPKSQVGGSRWWCALPPRVSHTQRRPIFCRPLPHVSRHITMPRHRRAPPCPVYFLFVSKALTAQKSIQAKASTRTLPQRNRIMCPRSKHGDAANTECSCAGTHGSSAELDRGRLRHAHRRSRPQCCFCCCRRRHATSAAAAPWSPASGRNRLARGLDPCTPPPALTCRWRRSGPCEPWRRRVA